MCESWTFAPMSNFEKSVGLLLGRIVFKFLDRRQSRLDGFPLTVILNRKLLVFLKKSKKGILPTTLPPFYWKRGLAWKLFALRGFRNESQNDAGGKTQDCTIQQCRWGTVRQFVHSSLALYLFVVGILFTRRSLSFEFNPHNPHLEIIWEVPAFAAHTLSTDAGSEPSQFNFNFSALHSNICWEIQRDPFKSPSLFGCCPGVIRF